MRLAPTYLLRAPTRRKSSLKPSLPFFFVFLGSTYPSKQWAVRRTKKGALDFYRSFSEAGDIVIRPYKCFSRGRSVATGSRSLYKSGVHFDPPLEKKRMLLQIIFVVVPLPLEIFCSVNHHSQEPTRPPEILCLT
jgi:hypothetical protein